MCWFTNRFTALSIDIAVRRWCRRGPMKDSRKQSPPNWSRSQAATSRRPRVLPARKFNCTAKGSAGSFNCNISNPGNIPVAETMCTYMISQAKRNYVDFINGIKEGLTPEESLTKRFKAGEDRLVPEIRGMAWIDSSSGLVIRVNANSNDAGSRGRVRRAGSVSKNPALRSTSEPASGFRNRLFIKMINRLRPFATFIRN